MRVWPCHGNSVELLQIAVLCGLLRTIGVGANETNSDKCDEPDCQKCKVLYYSGLGIIVSGSAFMACFIFAYLRERKDARSATVVPVPVFPSS
mmetsp:Transcript_47453/g.75011  ORF Transcript_47453/g.75011 Transcript_47453/m.75011 type:complete len:93 (+) Transcript_47453:63-341(+)